MAALSGAAHAKTAPIQRFWNGGGSALKIRAWLTLQTQPTFECQAGGLGMSDAGTGSSQDENPQSGCPPIMPLVERSLD